MARLKAGSTIGGHLIRSMNDASIQVITTYTASGSISSTDDVVLGNHASTDITLALPAVSGNSGKLLYCKNINTATVTIAGNGTDKIDGAGTVVLSSQYQTVQLLCNGTEWYTL